MADSAQGAASSSIPLQVPGSLHNSLNRQRSGGLSALINDAALKTPSQDYGKNDLQPAAPNVWKCLYQWMQVTS